MLPPEKEVDLDQELESMFFGIHPLTLIGLVSALLIWCLVIYVIQAGLFHKITVKTVEPSRGQLTIAYKTGRGPYNGAGELFTDICSIVFNRDHIGIYYDDPDAVPANDFRYAVGVILATGSEDPDPVEMEACLQNGCKIVHFPKPNHVVLAEFPFKNTLSIYMGIFRVYPKLKEYIATRGLCAYPALEIYTSDKIEFVMPLSKQDDFFVPEFCEEQESIATTEFSNHPDHAAADEELKNKDNVFAKPATPPRQNGTNESQRASVDEDNSAEKASEESESGSEFERVEAEN